MNRLIELKPCPFCGGAAERIDIEDGDNAGGSFVHCTECDASGNIEFGFKGNFVSNWNRRALSAALAVEAGAKTRATDSFGNDLIERDLVSIVMRMSRHLQAVDTPAAKKINAGALDYLRRKGLMPSPLRAEETVVQSALIPASSVAQFLPTEDGEFNGNEWEGPLTPEEQGMVDAAWETHKAAGPASSAVEGEAVAISRALLGKIVDEVFDGAIEDASVIGEIYACIKRHEAPTPAGDAILVHNVEELRLAAVAIRKYMPETLPANEKGQIHFARALAEAAAEAIEYALPASPAPQKDDNAC